MKFFVSSRIDYEIRPPATLLLNIRARNSRAQKVLKERFVLSPEIGSEEIFSEPDHNRFDRVAVSDLDRLTVQYEAEVEVEHQVFNSEMLRKVPTAQLAPAQLPFLLPSRYCQSDRLGRLAWQKFSHIKGAYEQVFQITEWIQANVEYVPGTTTSMTSAYDTPTECVGVCRDFAHLGIALCRALTIPARYFTGYSHLLEPRDFHACFEAYIGDCWVLFDATALAPPNGLVRIGTGRDAADVAVCTIFGFAQPVAQDVNCKLMSGAFVPLAKEDLKHTAISLSE